MEMRLSRMLMDKKGKKINAIEGKLAMARRKDK